MVVCLKLKKAFRKPSADCSSAGAFITHLCSKSSSLISRDGGKENRENQKDLKKNKRVCSWVLFFSCTLSVFSSWIIHVLSVIRSVFPHLSELCPEQPEMSKKGMSKTKPSQTNYRHRQTCGKSEETLQIQHCFILKYKWLQSSRQPANMH